MSKQRLKLSLKKEKEKIKNLKTYSFTVYKMEYE